MDHAGVGRAQIRLDPAQLRLDLLAIPNLLQQPVIGRGKACRPCRDAVAKDHNPDHRAQHDRRADGTDARELSRTFECFDHTRDGVNGFVTITGGKTTTARAMAERVTDIVCQKLNINAECRTREVPLSSYRLFFEKQNVLKRRALAQPAG